MLPVYPRADAPAIRVLVRAAKGAQGPQAEHPGLILNDAGGKPTAAAEAVLRSGETLSIAQAHELAPHAAQILLVEVRKADYATNQQEQHRELGIHNVAFLSSPRRGGGCCNAKSIPKLKNRQFKGLPAQNPYYCCAALY